jgi:hypothetical protein
MGFSGLGSDVMAMDTGRAPSFSMIGSGMDTAFGSAGRSGGFGSFGATTASTDATFGDPAAEAPAPEGAPAAPAPAVGGLGAVAAAAEAPAAPAKTDADKDKDESLVAGTTLGKTGTTVDPLSRDTMDMDGNKVATVGGHTIGGQIAQVGTNLGLAAMGPLGLVGQAASYLGTGQSIGSHVAGFADRNSSPSLSPISTSGADAASQVDTQRQAEIARGVVAGTTPASDAYATLSPDERAQVDAYVKQLAAEQAQQAQPAQTKSGFSFARQKNGFA